MLTALMTLLLVVVGRRRRSDPIPSMQARASNVRAPSRLVLLLLLRLPAACVGCCCCCCYCCCCCCRRILVLAATFALRWQQFPTQSLLHVLRTGVTATLFSTAWAFTLRCCSSRWRRHANRTLCSLSLLWLITSMSSYMCVFCLLSVCVRAHARARLYGRVCACACVRACARARAPVSVCLCVCARVFVCVCLCLCCRVCA
jgi:hypothetical protein